MTYIVHVALLVLSCLAQEAFSQLSADTQCRIIPDRGFCQRAPYNHSALPNYRNWTSPLEINEELATYLTLYLTGCSNAIVHLLCAYYYPFCAHLDLNNRDTVTIIPPCRELCRYVRASCEPELAESDLIDSWPPHFDCDQFPSANGTDLCLPGNSNNITVYQSLPLLPVPGYDVPAEVKRAKHFWSPSTVTPTTPNNANPTPTQPANPNNATPTPTQPENLNNATPTPTQPENPNDATPTPTQPENPNDATPTPTQPENPNNVTPTPTQPENPNNATPTPTQPANPNNATPTPTQSENPNNATPTPTQSAVPSQGSPPMLSVPLFTTTIVVTLVEPDMPNGEVVQYNIRWYNMEEGVNNSQVVRVDGQSMQYSLEGLSPGRYVVQVQIVNALGVGDYSEPAEIEVVGVPAWFIIAIIGGVFGAGVLVAVTVVVICLIRICVRKRTKPARNFQSTELSRL